MARPRFTRRWVVSLSASVVAVAATAAFTLPAGASEHSGSSHGSHDHGTYVCHDGAIPIGTYHSVLVVGDCSIPYTPGQGALIIHGDLTVAHGASLNKELKDLTMATVYVFGDVNVGRGATLGLGCTALMAGDPELAGNGCNPNVPHSDVVIFGNLTANGPYTMYLDGVTVAGKVTSHGGGPGVTLSPYVNFVFKDNTVGRGVTITGWQGAWIGAIRNTVGGSLAFNDNHAARMDDGNEIVANTIGENLVCFGNVPKTQFGDAILPPAPPPPYGVNTAEHALGQCADLLVLPSVT